LPRAVDWGLTPEEEKRPQSAQIFAQALPDPSTARTLTPEERAEQTRLIQESEPDPPSEVEDPTLISQVESALAGHIGPMAPFLVRRIAKNHRTIESLRSALADEITDERSRPNFLARTDSLRKTATTTAGATSRPA
jgi:hypothetical protein